MHGRENSLALQQRGDDINRRESDPRAIGKEIDAIYRGEPLVRRGFHPQDAGERQRQREGDDAPAGVETHFARAIGRAGFVLLQRKRAQPRCKQPPDAEENCGRNVKSGHREHRQFGGNQIIHGRVLRHPRINFRREQRDGQKQNRQTREQQRSEMFTKTADANRPTGIGQMMHQHEKQRAERDAVIKHKRQQPRQAECGRDDHRTDRGKQSADDHQDGRQLAPAGQVQWRQSFGFVAAHIISARRTAPPSNRSSSPASSIATRANTR